MTVKLSLRGSRVLGSLWKQANPLPLLNLVLDALAPARCIDCCIDGTWYCKTCRNNFPPAFQVCIGCKTDHPRGLTCSSCREDITLTGALAAGQYSHKALQRGIEWLKFKGVRELSDVLAARVIPQLQLIGPITELSNTAMLVPIPLHTRKHRQRGFNQSEDIARSIGTLCNIEVANLLTRTKSTASQARLPHNMRAANIHNAFSVACSPEEYAARVTKKPIIILIDDVATTGSTLIEAAGALPELSNTYIWGATVARG